MACRSILRTYWRRHHAMFNFGSSIVVKQITADMSAAYDASTIKLRKKWLLRSRIYGAGKLLDDEFKTNPLKTRDQVNRIPIAPPSRT